MLPLFNELWVRKELGVTPLEQVVSPLRALWGSSHKGFYRPLYPGLCLGPRP